MSSNNLFRAEALRHQGVKLNGSVSIAQPLSATALTFILLAVTVLTLLFLSQASFNRKETVFGFLKPDMGLARVAPQRSGTILEVYIEDGEQVVAGQKLALISADEYLAPGVNLSGQLLASIAEQRKTLETRQIELSVFFTNQSHINQKRIENLQVQINESEAQQQLMQQRAELNKQRYENYKKLRSKGHISEAELNKQQELMLSIQQQLAESQISYQSLQGQLIQLKAQLDNLPHEYEQQKATLSNELSRLSQQESELSIRGEVLLTAPVAGRVTNLSAEVGSMALAGKSVLTIYPDDSSLYATLLIPTRAYGFVQLGQETRLRYDAFPYQRFGLYRGEIVQQSKVILLPNEVDMPISVNEPVYQVQVRLDSQKINAYGEEMPLQAGMSLSADIVLEQRSLISWLFEPILSLRGRL